MGSPASPVLASLVMKELIAQTLSRCKFHIPFLYVYVDDIILSVHKENINDLLLLVNS